MVEKTQENKYDGYTERVLSITDKVGVGLYCCTYMYLRIVLADWQDPTSGDTVPDSELELTGQVLQPTDHHYCGGGGVQGTAQD